MYIFLCHNLIRFWASSCHWDYIIRIKLDTHSNIEVIHTALQRFSSQKHSRAYARGGGLGLTPPLNLLSYENVITYAKEFVYVFVHFLLVWCQLNAKTTEWFCMKIYKWTKKKYLHFGENLGYRLYPRTISPLFANLPSTAYFHACVTW